MLRLLLVALVVAGCAAPPVAIEEVAVVDDGYAVTAIRVVPLVHQVDERETVQVWPCQTGEICRMPLAGPTGLTWEDPVFDFGDPAALFWRVQLQLRWDEGGSEPGVGGPAPELQVFATTPCGIACLQERRVASAERAEPMAIGPADIFLEPGETGIRVRLNVEGLGPGGTSMDYHLEGSVSGYRPAGDPPIVLA